MTLKWVMTELLQNPAFIPEAQQVIKKEEFEIARGSNTYKRLWRSFPCIMEANMEICSYMVPKHIRKR
jgi:hypothetical protein